MTKRASMDQFLTADFKRCLLYLMCERALAMPETINGETEYTREQYGTCVHPDDPTCATFRAWAIRTTAYRAISQYCFGESKMRGLVAICMEYMESRASYMTTLAIAYALVFKRYDSIMLHEFFHGYLRSADFRHADGSMKTMEYIPRTWARFILAHAKYDPPGSFRCGSGMSTKASHEMLVENRFPFSDTNRFVIIESTPKGHGRGDVCNMDDLCDDLPLAVMSSGKIPVWSTGAVLPAPGAYPGISEHLVAMLRSVEPCRMSAREMAHAYSYQREEGRRPNMPTDCLTLAPEMCMREPWPWACGRASQFVANETMS